MIKKNGKSVSKGSAMGPVVCMKKNNLTIPQSYIQDVNDEWNVFLHAKNVVKDEIKLLQDKARSKVDDKTAAIFEVYAMLIDDVTYLKSIKSKIIENNINAIKAVYDTGNEVSQMFQNMEDEYMKVRSADIVAITKMLLQQLSNCKEDELVLDKPSILVADDLTPAETLNLDLEKVLAFVTKKGTTNSHTAILARMMGIPALVQVDIDFEILHNNMQALVDCEEGMLCLDPNDQMIENYNVKKLQEEQKHSTLECFRGKETRTKDGKKVKLFANISNLNDVDSVLKNDGEGIGLFRSECLYLQEEDYPSEEKQFQLYKSVLQKMQEKQVVIRTLDIGADKRIEYFNLDKEENPAMGLRAIRICLTRPELFKAQLRALYRASVYGNLAIMFPMITSIEEVKQIKQVILEVKNELTDKNIPFSNVEVGIMIETPAAALISDLLALHVDFFSIGTNDLSQYTMAIDRQNENVDKFFNPYHEAVLRLIKMTVENAHDAGIWCGICGELGADETLTKFFLDIGIDELSVAPKEILQLRAKIAEIA